MKIGRRRAVSFALAILVTASCVFCTGVSGTANNSSTAAEDDNYFYVPTNLYKYDRAGSARSVENMAINQATLMAARAKTGSNTEIRALYFDKASLQYGGDWSQYHAPGSARDVGLVNEELDKDGNLQWNSGKDNGRPYQYVTADLFRSGTENTPAYRKDFTDLSFPLKREKDQNSGKFTGYYSFDSAKQRAILDKTNKNIIIEEPQTIPGNHAQYSPFYNGDTDENSLNKNQDQQYSFGMDMHMQFTASANRTVYNPSTGNYDDMKFSFSGDDDVWVFVDGKLVLDLGGVHQQLMGSIDFAKSTYSVWDYNNISNQQEVVPSDWDNPHQSQTGLNYYVNNKSFTFQPNSTHTLTVYYLERGAGMSNFRMKCNLLQSSSFEVEKQLVGKTAAGDKGIYTFQVQSSKNGSSPVPVAKQPFEIYNVDGGTYVGSESTDKRGNLSLKAGQKAVFRYHVQGSSPDASSFAGQTITFTETGQNAVQYETTWQTTGSSTVRQGNGKTVEITAPPDNDSAQKAGAVFTNKLPTDITSPIKTAVQKSADKRTYDITLTTSTVDNSTNAVFTKINATDAVEGIVYYQDANKDNPIHLQLGLWREGASGVNTLLPQPQTVYRLDADAQTTQPITGATVRDTIDPRFEVVDDNGKVLTENTSIYGGEFHIQQGNDPAYVEWTNQTIPLASSQWKQTIHIKAKDEFIGGNDIPTNVAEGSYVSFTQNGKNVSKLFNQPTVNVPIRFSMENATQTIFLGDQTPSVTLEPYTLKDDGTTKVSGDGMFCGMDKTGSFSYQWTKADKAELGGATDNKFPDKQIPLDTTFYTLTATFNPDKTGTDLPSQCGAPAVVTTAQGKYTVNVVKGELDLTKIMDAQYPAPAFVHPRQSFVFKIIRTDPDTKQIAETFYEVISPDQVNSGKTQKITGLKKGIYTVTEETGGTTAAWRYNTNPTIVNWDSYNQTKNDGKVYIGWDTSTQSTKAYSGAETGNGFVTANPAAVQFTNSLNNSQWVGDTTFAVNTIFNP